MVIPQWGLSILTEVWREEKGGYYLAWSFPFTGGEWPSTATSGHIKYLDESTCEYSVCVFTGGREGRKEGRACNIYETPATCQAWCWVLADLWLGGGEGEEGSRHDGGFWQNWVFVPTFLACSCSCPLVLFLSFSSSSGVTLSHVFQVLPWLTLSGSWGGYDILSTSPHLSTEGGRKNPSHQGSGYWGRNAGNLRALLAEDLLLAARPATYRSRNLRQITVFYYICSLHLKVMFKSSDTEPTHLGLNPESAIY